MFTALFKFARTWVAPFVLILMISQSIFAAAVLEDALAKAVFLFNLAKFTEWSAISSDTFLMCVQGDDAVADYLAGQAGKSIGEQRLDIQRDVSLAGLVKCQVVFFGNSAASLNLSALVKQPILTVSDRAGFIEAGGMLQIGVEARHVIFTVELDRLRASGLNLSAHVLRLAKQVYTASP